MPELMDQKARAAFGPAFMGETEIDVDFSTAKIVVLPIPYDKTSSYHKGADRGPQAILESSTQVEVYDIETNSQVYQQGIFTLAPLSFDGPPEELANRASLVSEHLLKSGKLAVFLGGDHSITPGLVMGAKKVHQGLSVLQLDAHGDTRESYLGSRFNHACVMARVREICPIVQVGIRAIDHSEAVAMDRSRVFFSHSIHEFWPDRGWFRDISELLTDSVYVTIDLDCFDSGLMPSTGTPEPGGLSWPQVTGLLRYVAKHHRVVGFDIVELLPRASNPAPDFLAAKLAYTFLSYIFDKK